MNNEKVKELKIALERCKTQTQNDCRNCPYGENPKCLDLLISNSTTYINELEKHAQNMENEVRRVKQDRNRKEELASKYMDVYNDSLKQFAERLKVKTRVIVDFYKDHADKSFNGISEKEIDETLKEFLK